MYRYINDHTNTPIMTMLFSLRIKFNRFGRISIISGNIVIICGRIDSSEESENPNLE